jgi:hypothetical protein
MRLLIIILLLISFNANAATKYWVGGGTTANWNASPITNWAATDGGTIRVAAPTTSDSVYFTGTGVTANSNSTISATTAFLSYFFVGSGYSATLTFNANLQVAGGIVFGANMTIGGLGYIVLSGTSSITSNGKTFTGGLDGAGTCTLNDNLTINLNLLANITLNGNNIYVKGSFQPGSTGIGTTVVNMIGTGTISTTNVNNSIQNSIVINTSGTITIGTMGYANGTFTYTAGTVNVASAATLAIGANTIFNTNGINWGTVTTNTNTTIRLNSLFTSTRQMTLTGNITFTGIGGFSVDTLNMNNTTATTTTTLDSSATYTVNKAFNSYTSYRAVAPLFTSSGSVNRASFNLAKGCKQNVLANFTRINANGGRTIWDFNGTITDCLNIRNFTYPNTIGSGYAY